ncbi:MAG: hypothetical protein JSV51_01030 [Candidatus Bathyarchaeota archaeon]|nr:MAG: hypothetical protein JSV51_01030 [Candidatus Bathyarchaeota archaeon]
MVVVGRINSIKDFHRFMKKLDVRGMVFIVKPGWDNTHSFTSAETLDWLFSTLRGRIKLIEGYSMSRTKPVTDKKPEEFTPSQVFITPSKAKAHWQLIKEQDESFLTSNGIDRVLEKHDAEYINVTEEVWSLRNLDSGEVKDFVDSKYGVLVNQEMYNLVPTRVYELKGSSFISLNVSHQIHGQVSLSTRSLLSLIPNPARHRDWQDKGESHLSQRIVDINKIYRSLFSPCFWINKIKDSNIFVGSKNSVEADAVAAKLMGIDPENIGYLSHAATVFGGYDKNVLMEIPKSL